MHAITLYNVTNHSSCRVEQLIVTSSLEVDLTSLRQSIQALQTASVRLDTEKVEAEAKLRKILGKLKKRQALRRKLYHKLRKGICKFMKYIGKECKAPKDREFAFALFNLTPACLLSIPQVFEEATVEGD